MSYATGTNKQAADSVYKLFEEALEAGMKDAEKGPTFGMFIGTLNATADRNERNFDQPLLGKWKVFAEKYPGTASLLRRSAAQCMSANGERYKVVLPKGYKAPALDGVCGPVFVPRSWIQDLRESSICQDAHLTSPRQS